MLVDIIFLSLQVSIIAVLIGTVIGVPVGTALGYYHFPGRKLVIAAIYTLMSFPTVLIGVIVYLLLSHKGPLGEFDLLFTPSAIVMAEVFLVTPIIIGLTMAAVLAKDRNLKDTIVSLGASPIQQVRIIIKEAKKGIWTGVATAFGRAISEVGAVMLVGGNIEGSTRVMTTAIILETRKGNLNEALTLGFVLLLVSFSVNIFLMLGMMKTMGDKGLD